MTVYVGIINTSDGNKVLEAAFPHLLRAPGRKSSRGPSSSGVRPFLALTTEETQDERLLSWEPWPNRQSWKFQAPNLAKSHFLVNSSHLPLLFSFRLTKSQDWKFWLRQRIKTFLQLGWCFSNSPIGQELVLLEAWGIVLSTACSKWEFPLKCHVSS